MNISNETFNELMQLDKFIESKKNFLPHKGEKAQINIYDSSKREKFIVDINRSGKFEDKATIQTRYVTGGNVVIIRLDINGPEHENPDGNIIERNHIHIYKEGYDTRYAYNLSSFHLTYFKNITDFLCLFDDYCDYNNIKQNTDGIPIQGVI